MVVVVLGDGAKRTPLGGLSLEFGMQGVGSSDDGKEAIIDDLLIGKTIGVSL